MLYKEELVSISVHSDYVFNVFLFDFHKQGLLFGDFFVFSFHEKYDENE